MNVDAGALAQGLLTLLFLSLAGNLALAYAVAQATRAARNLSTPPANHDEELAQWTAAAAARLQQLATPLHGESSTRKEAAA
jgi:hypothetical protein